MTTPQLLRLAQGLWQKIQDEYRLLLGFVAAIGLAVTFGALAGEMLEGDFGAFDRNFLLALRHLDDLATPIGPHFIQTAMIDITAMGSETILTLVTLMALGFLLLRKRYRQTLLVAAAVGGGAILSGILKSLFSRARPDVVPRLAEVSSGSFPSGHAMNSAIIYLTIAVLIARSYEDPRTRSFIVGLAALATLTIGFSRLYLGVHWPTDVAAGWLVGLAWALLMGMIAITLQKRRQIEQPVDDTTESEEKL